MDGYKIGRPLVREHLYTEYARMIAMCNAIGKDVLVLGAPNPWQCVRRGNTRFQAHPNFTGPADTYAFTVGMIGTQLIWPGDKVYVGHELLDWDTVLDQDDWDIIAELATLAPPPPVFPYAEITLVRSPEPKRRPKVGEYVRRSEGALGHRGFFLCVRPGQWLSKEEIWVLKEK